jgi:hypothetical protein
VNGSLDQEGLVHVYYQRFLLGFKLEFKTQIQDIPTLLYNENNPSGNPGPNGAPATFIFTNTHPGASIQTGKQLAVGPIKVGQMFTLSVFL